MTSGDQPTAEQATSFFETLYRAAAGDARAVPWADLAPHPRLAAWLATERPLPGPALVVGCGLGDDAEELARHGHAVTAFDASPEAIRWCRERFPASPVDYLVADLFRLPSAWVGAFDLVVENRTVQSLPLALRSEVVAAIASSVAPGGRLWLTAWARPEGPVPPGPPWPVARSELEPLREAGLEEGDLDEAGGQFVGWFHRPGGG